MGVCVCVFGIRRSDSQVAASCFLLLFDFYVSPGCFLLADHQKLGNLFHLFSFSLPAKTCVYLRKLTVVRVCVFMGFERGGWGLGFLQFCYRGGSGSRCIRKCLDRSICVQVKRYSLCLTVALTCPKHISTAKVLFNSRSRKPWRMFRLPLSLQ